jgi:predicted enzyme related to lactoylglutathione lyase
MPQVTSHKQGTFCWVELATNDPNAAKSFYTKLFDWTINEIPLGDQGSYYMFQKEGRDAGAMYQQRKEEEGIPPHWNNYIAVADIDASTAQAKSLGATILAGPFDVMDAGRMSMVQDPQGAVFALWQAKNSIGVEVNNEPGTLCWNELYTPNIEGARNL